MISNKKYFETIRAIDREHTKELREAYQRAIDAAFEAAKEKSANHNDLIRAMERLQATFITRGMVYSAITTALVVLGLVIAYYANFGGH